MAKINRITQDRPKRDESKTAETRELRAQAQKLRRENARLRRELEKIAHNFTTEVDDFVPLAGDELVVKEERPKCPKCSGGNITNIPMGKRVLTTCRDCKWRKVDIKGDEDGTA